MASTNQSPQYKKVETEYLKAQTNEEKIHWLKEMIKECPKHKSAEKMLAQLKTRLKKLKQIAEKTKKSGKSKKQSIKKAEMQAVLVGFTNSGKSALMSLLTNAHVKISENQFTTQTPIQGMMNYQGVQIQIIDQPSLGSEQFDIGITNTADLIIIVVTNIDEIKKIQEHLSKAKGKQLIVFNKIDKLNENEKRKISETLKSKKYNFALTSWQGQGIEELKEKIFQSFEICRIYLKEPGKEPTDKPLIIKPDSTVLDVANKISHQLAKTIKEVHIWGPSSKFPNQRVGLSHIVKDKDIIEFKTR